jgi:hypothetical protein
MTTTAAHALDRTITVTGLVGEFGTVPAGTSRAGLPERPVERPGTLGLPG